ncbi:MAG: hypothetical protein WBD48_18310, partial [Pseudolabrys sp.]
VALMGRFIQGGTCMKAIGLVVTAMLLVSHVGTADAVSVKPSGKYAFTSIDSCEAKFTFAFGSYKTAAGPSTNAVRVINSVANGHIGSGVGYITFTPKTAAGGNVTMTLTEIGGGALRINNGGVNVTTKPESFSGTYSFTTTSFTFTPTGGSAMTYTMVYGALNASGVPSSLHLVRQDSSGEPGDPNNCVETITATR